MDDDTEDAVPSWDHLVVPEDAVDLYASMGPDEEQPHLFVHLPKVVWVHVYSLLDVPSLFRAQRVCKAWRNLINQPICWLSRRDALQKLVATVRATQRETGNRRHAEGLWEVNSIEDDDVTALGDEEVGIFGSPSVALLKRECKAHYIVIAVAEHYFHPRTAAVRALLEDPTDDAEREDAWGAAIELEPQCARIYYERARARENANNLQGAVADYTLACTLCPYDHTIRTRLGLTYHKMGHLERALHNYLKTAALAPRYQLAWNNAGSIFFNTGDYARAEKCFSRCIALDDHAAIAYNNRGLCHCLAGNGRAAVEDLTTAHRLNGNDRTALPNRAGAHILAENYDAAVQDCLTELGRWDPGNAAPESSKCLPYVHKHLGHAYLRKGEVESAIEHLQKAIELKKDYRQAYDLLAECLRLTGKTHEASEMERDASQYAALVGNNETIFSYYLR